MTQKIKNLVNKLKKNHIKMEKIFDFKDIVPIGKHMVVYLELGINQESFLKDNADKEEYLYNTNSNYSKQFKPYLKVEDIIPKVVRTNVFTKEEYENLSTYTKSMRFKDNVASCNYPMFPYIINNDSQVVSEFVDELQKEGIERHKDFLNSVDNKNFKSIPFKGYDCIPISIQNKLQLKMKSQTVFSHLYVEVLPSGQGKILEISLESFLYIKKDCYIDMLEDKNKNSLYSTEIFKTKLGKDTAIDLTVSKDLVLNFLTTTKLINVTHKDIYKLNQLTEELQRIFKYCRDNSISYENVTNPLDFYKPLNLNQQYKFYNGIDVKKEQYSTQNLDCSMVIETEDTKIYPYIFNYEFYKFENIKHLLINFE